MCAYSRLSTQKRLNQQVNIKLGPSLPQVLCASVSSQNQTYILFYTFVQAFGSSSVLSETRTPFRPVVLKMQPMGQCQPLVIFYVALEPNKEKWNYSTFYLDTVHVILY